MDPLIRIRQQAVDAVEAYSPAEQQFNRRRKSAGLVVGPLLFLAMLAYPMETLTPGASVCFMLPISTPLNAIAYSSGHVPIGTMMKYGVSLSILACAIIITMVTLAAPWLF